MNRRLGLDSLARASRRAVSAVTFLFRDDFTTNESAPLASPRTAEPGPGTATIVDTTNVLSITNNRLERTNAPTAWEDPVYVGNSIARETGLGLTFLTRPETADLLFDMVGWRRQVIGDVAQVAGAVYGASGDNLNYWGRTFLVSLDTSFFEINTNYVGWTICRSSGYFIVVNNILRWVADAGTDDPLYPSWQFILSYDTNIDNLRASQLPTPWDTDYGIATDRLAGVRTAGDTFTHEADALLEYEQVTVPSGGQTEFAFRMQDASNYWQVTVDSSGNLDLDEVVAGTPTQRGTSAGVISNSDRIVIICDDETIKVYDADVPRITYAGAANFKTETAGKLIDEGTGGSESDIISWPLTLSGTAKDALDAVADA